MKACLGTRCLLDEMMFDEQGYTTTGMVVALLLTLSLVFATAQVYRVNTASAAIQDVADASALAAENQVAQFMVTVRVCDAIVLSMSLTALIATGLGVAACCTPVTAGASETLLAAGKTVTSARNKFSRGATKTLNALQAALPFLAAASALNVAKKNNETNNGSDYVAIALLVPWEGEDIDIPDAEGTEEVQQEADESAEDLREEAEEAEQLSKELLEIKTQAWLDDCGNYPGNCMRQRVKSLTNVPDSENPMYESVDQWSFNVGLERIRVYYQARLAQEDINDYETTEERADSYLRKLMYAYAVKAYGEAYIIETEHCFDPHVPTIPKNTQELSQVPELYDQTFFPVTSDGKTLTMHAFDGCPNAQNATSRGTVHDLVEGSYAECELCKFNKTSLGSVAAATTSTVVGYEHYSRIFVEAAEKYEAVSSEAGSLLDKIGEQLKQAADYRIDVQPPGSYGAIALVVDLSESQSDYGFENAFVESSTTLGSRAAVSGATLIEDEADSNEGVITGFLSGLQTSGGGQTGVLSILLDCWSNLLLVYAQGEDALESAVEEAVDAIPFASVSGLGTWASGKVRDVVEDTGFQAANLNALKPVTVNTGLIAAEDDEEFAVRYLTVKSGVVDVLGGTALFSAQISNAEANAASIISGDCELTTIQPFGSEGPSIPITLVLPEAAQEAANGVLGEVASAIRGIMPKTSGDGAWE